MSHMVGFKQKLFAACCVLLALIETGFSQTPGVPTQGQQAAYAELTARSAALTPEQKAQATQLFSTGFSLWQSGDFGSAALAFKQGLDLDSANAPANFYYGDCLKQTGDTKNAVDYFGRAAALGAGTAEGFKAKSAVDALTNVATIIFFRKSFFGGRGWVADISVNNGPPIGLLPNGSFFTHKIAAGEVMVSTQGARPLSIKAASEKTYYVEFAVSFMGSLSLELVNENVGASSIDEVKNDR